MTDPKFKLNKRMVVRCGASNNSSYYDHIEDNRKHSIYITVNKNPKHPSQGRGFFYSRLVDRGENERPFRWGRKQAHGVRRDFKFLADCRNCPNALRLLVGAKCKEPMNMYRLCHDIQKKNGMEGVY